MEQSMTSTKEAVSSIYTDRHEEGELARMIEEQTAKLPSDIFLWAAGGSMIASLFLQAAGDKHRSLFIGQWAPSFLLLGIYNKLVKVAGSDKTRG
jgi:hypothetical protein